ncbi:MAG: shikimate kinase [Frankiales bacterium]|nr:shikimate kinase [Frankiales bacterium]
MITKLLLVGMMGSGKSSVGAALSTKLGWPYLDNDVLLERTAGASARALLDNQGEVALRQAESQVLTLLLGMPGPVIGSVAAGVVLDEKDRLRLVQSPAHVVWLRASPQALVRRVNGSDRPWLGEDPAAVLRRLGAERNGFFAEVADQVVDVDVIPVGAIAKAIIETLGPG